MEQPKKMLSKIIENESEIIIATPKRKSWVIILIFSLILLQFSNAILQVLFIQITEVTEKLIIIPIALFVIYFVLKGLFWQLIGIRKIIINNDELKYCKLAPLTSKTKTYKISNITSIEIKDESVLEGPLAMLQILGIKDKIKIVFNYGYETVSTISGFELIEANELKNIIERKVSSI